MLLTVEKVWGLGGLETPITPDEPDVLDVGDGVEGLGVDGWRQVVGCVGLFGSL